MVTAVLWFSLVILVGLVYTFIGAGIARRQVNYIRRPIIDTNIKIIEVDNVGGVTGSEITDTLSYPNSSMVMHRTQQMIVGWPFQLPLAIAWNQTRLKTPEEITAMYEAKEMAERQAIEAQYRSEVLQLETADQIAAREKAVAEREQRAEEAMALVKNMKAEENKTLADLRAQNTNLRYKLSMIELGRTDGSYDIIDGMGNVVDRVYINPDDNSDETNSMLHRAPRSAAEWEHWLTVSNAVDSKEVGRAAAMFVYYQSHVVDRGLTPAEEKGLLEAYKLYFMWLGYDQHEVMEATRREMLR